MPNYLVVGPSLCLTTILLFSCSVLSESLQPHELQDLQASLSSAISWSLLKLVSIDLMMMLSSHLILCCSLLLLPLNLSQHQGLFQWVGSHQEAKVLELQLQHKPPNEYSGLISFTIDSFYFLAVQRTLKSLLQHHSAKASILQLSAFFMVFLVVMYGR